jgi:hypothetical protein
MKIELRELEEVTIFQAIVVIWGEYASHSQA